jgi:hypothetical protein
MPLGYYGFPLALFETLDLSGTGEKLEGRFLREKSPRLRLELRVSALTEPHF